MAEPGYDYLKNLPQVLSKEEMENPMLVLRSFFLIQNELVEWRRFLRTLEKGINTSEPVWHGRSPGDHLSNILMMKKLIEAAWVLKYQDPIPDPVEQLDASNLSTMKNYSREDRFFFWWKLYPFYLTVEEMLQPYLVLNGFFSNRRLADWRRELDDWAESSLSTDDLEGYRCREEIFHDMEYLHKLLEASYLIYIREYQKHSNNLKDQENETSSTH